VVGAVAYDPKVVAIWEGIQRFFREEADLPVEVELFLSYPSLVRALLAQRIDIAWNTNLAYLQAMEWSGGACRPLGMRDTDRGWHTLLVAPVGGEVRNLKDIRGQVVALGSRDSGHAAILPVHFWSKEGLEEGVDYRSLRIDSDVGKHGDTGASERQVLAAVLDGRTAAGALGSPFWSAVVTQGLVDPKAVSPVWTSPAFSHCMFTGRPSLPSDVGDRFLAGLERMTPANPRHAEILAAEGLKAWLPPTAAGYDDLRDAARAQGFFRETPTAILQAA
jgi:ABC-type phosphate/phosphonate transport system substrate-binding protein